MLSWITGPRPEAINSHGAPDDEPTVGEPPETPAPVFAVRAFKQALFGTPAPLEYDASRLRDMPKVPSHPFLIPDDGQTKQTKIVAHVPSPTKPTGILMTPGTATARRKKVSFNAHVVDNEGKRPGKSGLPNAYPGKFPSPWTPRVEALEDSTTGLSARSKLTKTLFEVREASAKKPKQRARDDTDITLDLNEPRSQSGRYWKQEYVSYAEKSEKEITRLLQKQKAAKHYAKQKDEEAMLLATKLKDERQRHNVNEGAMRTQMQEYKEKLRTSLAVNATSAVEIQGLRAQVDNLERTMAELRKQLAEFKDIHRTPEARITTPLANATPKPDAGLSRLTETLPHTPVRRAQTPAAHSNNSGPPTVAITPAEAVNIEDGPDFLDLLNEAPASSLRAAPDPILGTPVTPPASNFKRNGVHDFSSPTLPFSPSLAMDPPASPVGRILTPALTQPLRRIKKNNTPLRESRRLDKGDSSTALRTPNKTPTTTKEQVRPSAPPPDISSMKLESPSKENIPLGVSKNLLTSTGKPVFPRSPSRGERVHGSVLAERPSIAADYNKQQAPDDRDKQHTLPSRAAKGLDSDRAALARARIEQRRRSKVVGVGRRAAHRPTRCERTDDGIGNDS